MSGDRTGPGLDEPWQVDSPIDRDGRELVLLPAAVAGPVRLELRGLVNRGRPLPGADRSGSRSPRGFAAIVRRMNLRPGWKLYAGVCLLMMALRQDFWYWHDPTLVFGVLPVGLAYQAGYSLLATLVMALLVRYCWPAHVDELEPGAAAERGEAAAP